MISVIVIVGVVVLAVVGLIASFAANNDFNKRLSALDDKEEAWRHEPDHDKRVGDV